MTSLVSSVWSGAKIGALIGSYAGQATLGKVLIRDDHRRTRFFIENNSRHCRLALRTMNINVEPVGLDPHLFHKRNYLIISNHLSYLDIMCLASVQPCMFVTSVDMGEVFFLGTMAELGGSLFIERRHRGQLDRDLTSMTEALKNGFNVVLYPEGTSTNGDTVMPFKKSLMMAAVEAGVDVLPMALKYTEINGSPFSAENRDKVCWYGDMSFAPHLAGVLKLKSAVAQLRFQKPIHITKNTTRHQMAEMTHAAVSKAYHHP